MDVEKRKRNDDREVEGKRTRVSEDRDEGGVTEPADDEVEEFFAILRRIRVAVKYFEKGNGEGGRRRRRDGESTEKRPPSSSSWNPSFEREDFTEVDGVKPPGAVVEEPTGLDLNADPEPERSAPVRLGS